MLALPDRSKPLRARKRSRSSACHRAARARGGLGTCGAADYDADTTERLRELLDDAVSLGAEVLERDFVFAEQTRGSEEPVRCRVGTAGRAASTAAPRRPSERRSEVQRSEHAEIRDQKERETTTRKPT